MSNSNGKNNNLIVDDVISNIIDYVYKETFESFLSNAKYGNFYFLGPNQTGKVGELFVKQLFRNIGFENISDETIHDEYDLMINNKKIEIKTARLGKSNTFQFNSINPDYSKNLDYYFLIGISVNQIYYNLIESHKIKYEHKERKYFYVEEWGKTQLVEMNPGNKSQRKLTLNVNKMHKMDESIYEVLKKVEGLR